MSKEHSKLIAGTMNWGAWGRKFNISAIQERIETFLTEDITAFDHADIYGGYTTEADFGTAWAEMNIDRKEVKFITKCGIKYVCEERDYSIKHYDYSKEHIIWSVENSLKNLQTEYIDVLLLHRPSPLMETEVIAEAVSDIQPMAWNPLGSVYKEAIPQTIRLRDLLQKLTVKYGVSDDLLLLAWVLKHPAKIQPVVGTTQMDRIKSLKQLHEFELELEDWFAIWTESIGTKIP